MIVRLTHRQHKRVMEIVGDQMTERWRDGVLGWFGRDVQDAATHRVDVSMPAIAWKRVWEVMFDHCFDNRGMRSKGVRVTDLNAAKAVRRALNARELHPALQGQGAIGFIAEIVPVWVLEGGKAGFTYTPYPERDLRFVILAPESREVRRQKITAWVPTKLVIERPILDEREHFRFL